MTARTTGRTNGRTRQHSEGRLADVDDMVWFAERFEENRSRLLSVAYRMLGSRTEAEDALQEAWLRSTRADGSTIDNVDGWLTTVVGRVCIDLLRTRQARRESLTGTWLPEPVVSRGERPDPEEESLLADSVGLALLVVLETLDPAERLAFVLHDMFAVPFAEIAPIVERTPEATRQLASRARRRVRGAPTRTPTCPPSVGSSTRSWPRPVPATSPRSSGSSTPTSCSASTPAGVPHWRPRCSPVPSRWPTTPPPRGRGSHRCAVLRWSTAPPASWPAALVATRSPSSGSP